MNGIIKFNTQDIGTGLKPTKFLTLPEIMPEKFVGICFDDRTAVDKTDVLLYGTARMTQMAEARWSHIEKTKGVYDPIAVAALEEIITTYREQGINVIFGTYGTPVFYAGTTPNPTYPDNITEGPWNELGECSLPTNYTALSDWCSFIVNWFNIGTSKASWFARNGAKLGKGIWGWEMGNEPHFHWPDGASVGNGNATGANGKGEYFTWYGVHDLVDFNYVQRTAIKGMDPTILVCNGGFAGNPTGLGAVFLKATGKVYPSITGFDCIDALAFHPYGEIPEGVVYGQWPTNQGVIDGNAANGVMGIATIDKILSTIDQRFSIKSLPYWITESGICTDFTAPTNAAWYNGPPSYRAAWTLQLWLQQALQGVPFACWWNYGSGSKPFFSGDWINDDAGVKLAANIWALHIGGKIPIEGDYDPGVRTSVEFQDGTSITASFS